MPFPLLLDSPIYLYHHQDSLVPYHQASHLHLLALHQRRPQAGTLLLLQGYSTASHLHHPASSRGVVLHRSLNHLDSEPQRILLGHLYLPRLQQHRLQRYLLRRNCVISRRRAPRLYLLHSNGGVAG